MLDPVFVLRIKDAAGGAVSFDFAERSFVMLEIDAELVGQDRRTARRGDRLVLNAHLDAVGRSRIGVRLRKFEKHIAYDGFRNGINQLFIDNSKTAKLGAEQRIGLQVLLDPCQILSLLKPLDKSVDAIMALPIRGPACDVRIVNITIDAILL